MCRHDLPQYRWVSRLYNPDGTSAGQDVASLCEECLISLGRTLVAARGGRTLVYQSPPRPPSTARARENREAGHLNRRTE